MKVQFIFLMSTKVTKFETTSLANFDIAVVVYPMSTMTLRRNDCLTPIQYFVRLFMMVFKFELIIPFYS